MPVEQQIAGVLWGVGIGLVLLAVVYVTIRGAWTRQPGLDPLSELDASLTPVEPVHEYFGGVAEAHGPVPLIVKLVIIGVAVWTVVYVAIFARHGFTFS